MDWADRVHKFHTLLGREIKKQPTIGTETINFYLLKLIVDSKGGLSEIDRDDSQVWREICKELRLGDNVSVSVAEIVRTHYEKDILPYEKWTQYAAAQMKEIYPEEAPVKRESLTPVNSVESIGWPTPKQDPQFNTSTSKKRSHEQSEISGKSSLPSPPPDIAQRMSTGRSSRVIEADENSSSVRRSSRRRQNSTNYSGYFSNDKQIEEEEEEEEEEFVKLEPNNDIPVPSEEEEDEDEDEDEEIGCETCHLAVDSDETDHSHFRCAECDSRFHFSCLDQRLSIVDPRRFFNEKSKPWYCPKCLMFSGVYLFEEGKAYGLDRFKKTADKFRDIYLQEKFGGVSHEASLELDEVRRNILEDFIEANFWRHTSDISCDLAVEYGADIKCDIKGSGFPSGKKDRDCQYVNDPWNLNYFPRHLKSMFHFLKNDISGVTVPWGYVGMMFSAFCWHSEDHYTYSLNYQHFGGTKTWYGIPGYAAEKFEKAGKELVPDLFEKQPDILFQRSTMISPELLLKKRVPCYVIDQRPGQFVVTFPKAYHAGFNHGFNFNEAVNYAPQNWVQYGLESIKSYKLQKRAPIFCHEALILDIAYSDKSPSTSKWLYPHISRIFEDESVSRRKILQRYPNIEKRMTRVGEDSDDEKFQCSVCNGLSYLSRVIVKDDDNETVYCNDHVPSLHLVSPSSTLIFEIAMKIEEIGTILTEVGNRANYNVVQTIQSVRAKYEQLDAEEHTYSSILLSPTLGARTNPIVL